MEPFRLFASLWAVVALSGAACSRNSGESKADGHAPPPGIRYEAHVAAGGVAPPAPTVRNPNTSARENVTAGGNLFAAMNCDGCHGVGGSGWVGPSLIDGRWRYGGADEEIFSSIYYGRPKGMPAYGGVVGEDGIWMMVGYLKSQPVPNVVPTLSYEETARAAPVTTANVAESQTNVASATAKTPEQMLAQYGCTACHAVDRKVVGPSFKDVAAKYRGQPDAENLLAGRVKNGSSGVWGSVPMTPNPQVPDADLHALVKWVLTLE